MARRIAAVASIYILTSLAWLVLASAVLYRTTIQDHKLKNEVGQLWGNVQVQEAPSLYYKKKRGSERKPGEQEAEKNVKTETVTTFVPLSSSEVLVDISLEHRRKGLLWYPAYVVEFKGRYGASNTAQEARDMYFGYVFPAQGAVYDNFRLAVGGEEVPDVAVSCGKVAEKFRLLPGETKIVEVSYRSQGLGQWWYDFGENVKQAKEFSLILDTDFKKVDFPQNGISPTSMRPTDEGWSLEWRYANLLTGARIGLELPERLNPGPWVSQVTFSAPVSLLLFFFALFMFTTLRGIRVHPLNYFFIAAAFFSFHLLLAYLVDHISIHAAFFTSAAVSILLVTTYMRLVVGNRFAFLETAACQFVYLILFSYTFFFRGFTGLAITALCVITLFVVMQLTGRIDWEVEFAKERRSG